MSDLNDAFDNILSIPLPIGDILMSEETLQSFEESMPGIREAAELVEKDLGDGEIVTFWRLRAPKEES
jgi:hypothetical protein